MLGVAKRQENAQKHVHVDGVGCDNLEEGSDHALLITNLECGEPQCHDTTPRKNATDLANLKLSSLAHIGVGVKGGGKEI